MLSRPSSAIPSSSGSRFLIFHNSCNRSHNFAPKRSSALSLSLSPWSHPHVVLESRTSSCVRVARKIRCLAVSPAEPASELKRETSDTENVSLETQPSFDAGENNVQMSLGIGSPSLPAQLKSLRMSLGDQAFFALALIAGTISIAFTSLVIALIPTLLAIRRAAISLTKLADTTRAELPSTMAAIRLSGMEISDLILELSDLSQEIADGINKSAQAVQAAEAGIRKMGQMARHQTMTIIQERASLPDIPLQPVVKGAADKTSSVIGQVKKSLFGFISRGGDYISDRMDG